MTFSTPLIILNTTKTGEKSLVLHCLTPGHGRRSFITSITKSAGMAYFLPLNILEAEVRENPKTDLWRISGFSAVHPLGSIRSSLHKNTMTLFMSEVLYRTIKDGANEDGLFDWCQRSILTLDALESDYANYHLRFLLELATALGFSPSMEGLGPFAGERYREIEALLKGSFAECMLLPLSGEVRSEIAEILLKYLGYHTESSINVRSLSVLKEIYR